MNLLFKLAAKFGLPSWLAALAAYLMLVALVFGVVWAIYDSGKRDERADWQAKENVAIIASQKKALDLANQNRALESLRAVETANLTNDYEGKLQDEKNHANTVVAAVRTGAKRLSISTSAVPACSGGISLAAATGRKVDAETRSELSQAAAEYVVRFGNEADETVIESNYVKDLLQQCHDHVVALQAQS